MFALVAIGLLLPWLIVLGGLAAERWLESSLRSMPQVEPGRRHAR
jgi:hypothetical protein